MAEQGSLVAFDVDCESCGDRLVVGHAFRVLAFCDADDLLRSLELLLLHYLEVTDDIHCGIRCDQSQLVKFLGVPVVTIKMKGHHIYNPYWNMKSHRYLLKSAADMTQLLTAEDIKKMSAQEIHKKIVDALEHDDWRWQSENRIKLKRKGRRKIKINIKINIRPIVENWNGLFLQLVDGPEITVGAQAGNRADAGLTDKAHLTEILALFHFGNMHFCRQDIYRL